MWDTWKNRILGFLSVAFSLLVGVFFLEEQKNKKLQTEVDTEKFKGQDNLIKQEQAQNDQVIQKEEQKIDQLQKPQEQDLTKTQVQDYWNGKKPS